MVDLKKTCRDAIAKWGTTHQVNQCQEECGELIAAINRLRRGRIDIGQLASEVADVRIVVEQMTQIVNELGGNVEAQIEKKLARLVERIEGK
jgi:NTP pyrophosphatase (non-canonical NTP hydrolase)